MKNYRENLAQPVAELIIAEGEGALKDISIKQASEIGILAGGALSQGVSKGPVESFEGSVHDDLEKIADYLDDNENSLRVSIIEEHANAFATSIETASSVLKNDIGGLVESITVQVVEERDSYLISQKQEDILPNVAVSESDYTFLDWMSLESTVYQDRIIEDTAAIAATRPELSMSQYDKVRSTVIRPNFNTLVLPEASQAEFLDILLKKFAVDDNGIPTERINRFVRALFSSMYYARYIAEADKMLGNNREIAEGCLFVVKMVEDWKRMSDAAAVLLSKYMDTPSEDKIIQNIKLIGESCTLLSYCALCNKNIIMQSKLILSKNIINKEVWENFVSQGYGIDRVHNYLKVVYRNRQLPIDGIGIDNIVDPSVDKRLEETIASIRSNQSHLLSDALIRSYTTIIKRTAQSFIEDNKYDCGVKKHIASDFVTEALKGTRHFTGDIASMQDFLYNTILYCFYKDTLVASLYQYLGKNSTELCSTEESMITDEDVIYAELKSIIQPLAKFLVTQLVVE